MKGMNIFFKFELELESIDSFRTPTSLGSTVVKEKPAVHRPKLKLLVLLVTFDTKQAHSMANGAFLLYCNIACIIQ